MTTVTREHLYNEVWAEPMTTVAKRYDVSSNYLARICERLKIPRPPRGYWQQKAAGQDVEQEPLPPPDPGDESAWRRGGYEYSRIAAPLPVFTGVGERRSRREERPKTHPLLVGVHDDFLDSRERRYEHDGYLKPKNHALPDIFVSKDALAASLDFANRFYLALEDNGHWVRAAADFHYSRLSLEHRESSNHRQTYESRLWSPARPTLAFIGGVAIGLTLFEMAENVEVFLKDSQWVRAPQNQIARGRIENWRLSKQFMPSNRLGLVAYSPYQHGSWQRRWEETKPGDLKKLIPSLVLELEEAAPKVADLTNEAVRQADERHRAHLAQQREERRKKLIELRAKAEDDSRESLLGVIDDWATARNVERFFEDLSKETHLSDEERAELRARAEQARALFGGSDAMTHLRRWSTPNDIFDKAKKSLWWGPEET